MFFALPDVAPVVQPGLEIMVGYAFLIS